MPYVSKACIYLPLSGVLFSRSSWPATWAMMMERTWKQRADVTAQGGEIISPLSPETTEKDPAVITKVQGKKAEPVNQFHNKPQTKNNGA